MYFYWILHSGAHAKEACGTAADQEAIAVYERRDEDWISAFGRNFFQAGRAHTGRMESFLWFFKGKIEY